MKWQSMIAEAYDNMFQEMEKVLDGLSLDDLHKRPSLGANPIGWLCWHAIRSCDRMLGDVVLGKQLWISASWNHRFNRPPDPNDTGKGHSLSPPRYRRLCPAECCIPGYRAGHVPENNK